MEAIWDSTEREVREAAQTSEFSFSGFPLLFVSPSAQPIPIPLLQSPTQSWAASLASAAPSDPWPGREARRDRDRMLAHPPWGGPATLRTRASAGPHLTWLLGEALQPVPLTGPGTWEQKDGSGCPAREPISRIKEQDPQVQPPARPCQALYCLYCGGAPSRHTALCPVSAGGVCPELPKGRPKEPGSLA